MIVHLCSRRDRSNGSGGKKSYKSFENQIGGGAAGPVDGSETDVLIEQVPDELRKGFDNK